MNKFLPIAACALMLIVGCNVGSAPATMNETQVQDAVSKLPVDQQIDYINRSPMSPDEKAKRIAEIKEKAGN